jgi:hypothetical protein
MGRDGKDAVARLRHVILRRFRPASWQAEPREDEDDEVEAERDSFFAKPIEETQKQEAQAEDKGERD